MKIGISSACFYPMLTENALEIISGLGVSVAEVFFNSFCELSGEPLKKMQEISSKSGLEICSAHGFANTVEGYFLFTDYERRRADALSFYKRVFEADAKLGAPIHILHGPLMKERVTAQIYAERFFTLFEAAKEFGVTLTQENVNGYKSGLNEFLKNAKKELGFLPMTVDVKQARRSGADLFELLDIAGKDLKHLHLSDYSSQSDCTVPNSNGLFDFSSFFKKLKSMDYRGNAVVEVYSSAFENEAELQAAVEYLNLKLEEAYE